MDVTEKKRNPSGCNGSTAEISYLLFHHYGIRDEDDLESIICRAAEKAFRYFCRRISFYDHGSVDEKQRNVKETNLLLAARIPTLIARAVSKSEDQSEFDECHRRVCEEVMRLYAETGGLSYGVAQRWLNQTLVNLVVIDHCTSLEKLNLQEVRKYFHVPVEESVVRVATERREGKYDHALKLPCAPYRDKNTGRVQMSCYRHGTTLSFEEWEHPEYMEFQTMIREKLNETDESVRKTYRDPIDWAFQAYTEATQPRCLG